MNGKNTVKTGERFPKTGQWIVQNTAPGGDDLTHKGADMMKLFNKDDIVPQFERKDVVWLFIR